MQVMTGSREGSGLGFIGFGVERVEGGWRV